MDLATAELDPDRFPRDPWRLVETEFDPSDIGRMETLFSVANGYVGMRGNLEEGREVHQHGTFVNGFHETWEIKHAEDAYGFARVGQTMVNAPDSKLIKLYVDDEPLLLAYGDLSDYERVLDFRAGLLSRTLVWRTPSGKHVRVTSRRMVSFVHRHLVVYTFEVTMLDAAAPIVISSQLLNRQDGEDEYHVPDAALGEGDDPRKSQRFSHRVLVPQLQRHDGDRVILGHRCANSGMTIATGFHHLVSTDCVVEAETVVGADAAKAVLHVSAQPGHTITITKFASYHTSRGVPCSELADRCERTLDRALATGTEQLFAEQQQWLDGFWSRADCEIEGQPAMQQALRWNLFQLAQATGRTQDGVAAKALTGEGYGGHFFWDTEIYVMPFLSYTSPEVARSLLQFRYRMLDHARKRARELNQAGALYPWRTISGEEASAYYAAGTAQYHINADIMYALDQYVNASGDLEFLRREGAEMLVETARLWEDLGFFQERGDGKFHIHAVTGPDEYTTVVNDNLFTNVMARFNLRRAADVIEELVASDPRAARILAKRVGLGEGEVAAWRAAAEAMAVPYDERYGIHPQDAQFLERERWDFARNTKRPLLLHYHPLVIYRFQVLKQADVVLALFLQGDQFTHEEKLRDFEYYDALTTGDSSLSACVQSIVAAEVGLAPLALAYYRAALWVDLLDTHRNTADGVHVASTGGVWSALVFGFGGLRDTGGRFCFDPRLPAEWPSITFRITKGDARLRVRVETDCIRFALETGESVEVEVRGEPHQVVAGAETAVVLEGQAPTH